MDASNHKQKKKGTLLYALGVLQICVGLPMALTGGIPVLASFLSDPVLTGLRMFAMTLLALLGVGGSLLLANGVRRVNLLSNYQKLLPALENRASVRLAELELITGQKPTFLIRDLRDLLSQGYFPGAAVDLERKDLVLQKLDLPEPPLTPYDTVYSEGLRLWPAPVVTALSTVVLYSMLYPFYRIADFVIAGAMALGFGFLAKKLSKPVVLIREKPYTALPPAQPLMIATGNEALDELYTDAMRLIGELNAAILQVANPKMQKPMNELLSISRQIFAFVEKNPQKVRQIRQFTGYYLPTTVTLMQRYAELTREPHKGENILKSMARIEDSVGDVVETFRHELDNLYSDTAMDISVDLEVMQSMARRTGIAEPRNDQNKGE